MYAKYKDTDDWVRVSKPKDAIKEVDCGQLSELRLRPKTYDATADIPGGVVSV